MKYNKVLPIFGMVCSSFLANIKAQTIEQVINDKQSILVDVRSPEQFQVGSVRNAINIPLDELKDRLEDFKGKKVVVFCKKGDRAKMAEKELEKYGIKAFNAETMDKVKEVQVIDYKDKLSFRNDKPTFSYIKKGKKMKQVAVSLGKGAVLEKHITDQQAVIVIVKGKIKFNISGKDIILKESDTYDIPINVEHELTGLDDENMFIITKGDWN